MPPSKPSAVVVLLGESALQPKEVETLLNAAIAQMRETSGYELDAMKSLNAGSEAITFECTLDYDCLLRVGEGAEADAVLGVEAVPDDQRLSVQLLWVASDARGLPGESASNVTRTPQALEAAVRQGVKKIIPQYARRGVGGLTILAESGADVLIDGVNVGKAPMEKSVVVSAGFHRIDVVTQRQTMVTRTVEVREARRQVVDLPSPTEALSSLTDPPPPPPGRAMKTASYVVGGAGVLALMGGLVFGLQSSGINAQLRDGVCRDTPCTSGLTQVEAERLYQQGNTQATVGNVGVATGLFLAAGAGVMYFLAHRVEQEALPDADAAAEESQ